VAVVSVLLGVAYNLVPLAWFGLHRLLVGPSREDATTCGAPLTRGPAVPPASRTAPSMRDRM
jgi:hypothetical protein